MVFVLIFLGVLGLLVLVHELGHFVAAKKFGARVDEFGIGFPPKAFGIKRGETLYSINWVPLGGFVKIKGEQGENADDQDSFGSREVWQKSIIILAGVTMNLLLAFVLLSIGFTIGLPQAIDDLPANAAVADQKINIVSVVKDSPAAEAGITIGDAIVSLDDQALENVNDVQSYIKNKGEEAIELKLTSGAGEKKVVVTPAVLSETNELGLGVGLVETGIVSYGPIQAVWQGAVTTVLLTKAIVVAFYDIIKGLLITQQVSVDIAGPVGIAVLTGEIAQLGFVYLLQFVAILSINLAVINALPIPALDGGRFVFLIIEKFRGRPIPSRIEAMIHNVGFSLLILLVLLVTYRDFARYGGQIISSIKNTIGI